MGVVQNQILLHSFRGQGKIWTRASEAEDGERGQVPADPRSSTLRVDGRQSLQTGADHTLREARGKGAGSADLAEHRQEAVGYRLWQMKSSGRTPSIEQSHIPPPELPSLPDKTRHHRNPQN